MEFIRTYCLITAVVLFLFSTDLYLFVLQV